MSTEKIRSEQHSVSDEFVEQLRKTEAARAALARVRWCVTNRNRERLEFHDLAILLASTEAQPPTEPTDPAPKGWRSAPTEAEPDHIVRVEAQPPTEPTNAEVDAVAIVLYEYGWHGTRTWAHDSTTGAQESYRAKARAILAAARRTQEDS